MIKDAGLRARLERIWTEAHAVADKAHILAGATSDFRHRAGVYKESGAVEAELYQISNAHDEILSCAQILERAAGRLAEILDAKEPE